MSEQGSAPPAPGAGGAPPPASGGSRTPWIVAGVIAVVAVIAVALVLVLDRPASS